MEIISSVVVTALSGSDGTMLFVISSLQEALLLDNQSSVKREQSASSQSRNRPSDIFHPDSLMAALHILIFLCVTCSLLATSPLVLLEQPVCTEELIKMLSTFLRWRGQVQSSYPWSLMLWGFGLLSPGTFSSKLPAMQDHHI